MSDPWSSLQASEVVADDAAGGVHPAYANYDDAGHPQVGFDVFMDLPKQCLKCAAPASTSRVADVDVKRDALTHLLHRGDLSQGDDRVRSGKYKLDLPHCEPCLAAYTSSRRNYILSPFLLLLTLGGIVGSAVISNKLAIIVLLISLVLLPIALVVSQKRYKKCSVSIAALDTDGFIVLTRVDIQTGEAIVAASGGV